MQAKIKAGSYWVDCPYCDTELHDPVTGSLLWPTNETREPSVVCGSCGKTVQLPKQLRQ